MSKLDKIEILETEYKIFLKRGSVYIGITDPNTTKRFVYPLSEKKFIYKDVTLIPSFIKVCDEAIVNAADSLQNITDGSTGSIEFDFDQENDRITVTNYAPHSIEITERVVDAHNTMQWLPYIVFTKMHVSSNFVEEGEEKTNHKGGVNGIGTKAITYTSSLFDLEVCHNGKLYKQSFKNRGENILGGDASEPIISKTKSADYVRVSFVPDPRSFKTKGKLLTNDSIAFLRKRCCDIAMMNPNASIKINKKSIKLDKDDYFNMCGYDTSNYLQYTHKFTRQGIGNYVEFYVFDAKTYGDANFSFILNGLNVTHSSLHTNFISEFSSYLTDITKKDSKSKRNTSMIRDNLSIMCIAKINNIEFTGQTKEEFIYKNGKLSLGFDFSKDIETIKKMNIWKICNALDAANDFEKLEKTAKKTHIALIEKYEDAELANRKRKKGERATLILIEGDSAKNCVMAGMSKEQRRSHGVYPLKGKPINVKCSSYERIGENKEFNDIKTILGLTAIKDPVQNLEKNALGKLRYDEILIVSDQDHDGAHIRGLLVNMFNEFWPHLVESGFLNVLRTPIINVYAKTNFTKVSPTGAKVKINGNVVIKSCYTIKEYTDFEEMLSNTKENKIMIVPPGGTKEISVNKKDISPPKYIKGLGTFDKNDAIDVFQQYNVYRLIADGSMVENLDKVFSKKMTDARKEWIKFNADDEVLDPQSSKIEVSNLLDTEVRAFSRYNTSRALCNLVDGLKPSTRKILWVCYKDNHFAGTGDKTDGHPRVSQLGGSVSKETSYHHGEASLFGAIIGLAQNFVGTNNLNPLIPMGQFGTRLSGKGGAAQPRYIHTAMNTIMKKIFRKEDTKILEHLLDDGKAIEPVHFLPIVPFILFNGSAGIGSGFSCNIPKYHPVQVVDQMINRIERVITMDLDPWFKYSKCKIFNITDNDDYTSLDKEYKVPTVYQRAEIKIDLELGTIRIIDPPSRYMFDELKKYYQTISEDYITLMEKRKTGPKTKFAEPVLYRFDCNNTDVDCGIVLHLRKEWYPALAILKKRYDKQLNENEVNEIDNSLSDVGTDSEIEECDEKEEDEEPLPSSDKTVSQLISKLRLIDTKNLSFSNAWVISEDNKIVRLKGTMDVIDRFYYYRYGKYKKRKVLRLKEMDDEIRFKSNIAKFIRDIREKKVSITESTEQQVVDYLVENDFDKVNDNFDYLLSIQFRHATIERAEKLEKDIKKLKEERMIYKNKKIPEIWIEELKELRDALLDYSETVKDISDVNFPFA